MNKTLVITGASKGIGLASARLFQSNGYSVINLSRSNCDLENVININIDMSNEAWLKPNADQILSTVGEPDQLVLLHNAAMMTKDTVSSLDGDVLRQVLQLNVVAAAELNTLLTPKMKPGSSILYISSTLGRKAVANTHAYVISKHAVIGQMRATCQDLAGSMIHTAAVCPGFTETEMLKEHLGANPDIYDQITAGIAHRRLAQPEEIADTLLFCANNPVINGAVLDANLGQIES